MKRFAFFILAYVFISKVSGQQSGTFHDTEDGKIYKTVKIGNQIWMAENLAYKPSSGNYWAYDNDEKNVAKYGYLYDWETAIDVCPVGWHLPSEDEWAELLNFVGNHPGTKLKATYSWVENGNGTDDYGFSALASGYRNQRGFYLGMGKLAYWWTSSDVKTYPKYASYRFMSFNFDVVHKNENDKVGGKYVRCIKD